MTATTVPSERSPDCCGGSQSGIRRTSIPRPTCSQQQQQQQPPIPNELFTSAAPHASTFGAVLSGQHPSPARTRAVVARRLLNTARASLRALDSTADTCTCLTYDDSAARILSQLSSSSLLEHLVDSQLLHSRHEQSSRPLLISRSLIYQPLYVTAASDRHIHRVK